MASASGYHTMKSGCGSVINSPLPTLAVSPGYSLECWRRETVGVVLPQYHETPALTPNRYLSPFGL
jgi:hypothetical protein